MAAMESTQGFQNEVMQVQVTQLDCYIREPVQVKQDFSSLFSVVQDVLKHTTSAAEKCLLGQNGTISLDSKAVPSINCPLKVLKRIHCAVACEADSGRNVTASVIKLLSAYSCAERAVLTLAAFALSYGELLVYADRQQLSPFALLVSSLRRVDEIIRVKQEEQFKTAIIDLNAFTNLSVEFIALILELENLSKKDCIDDLSIVTEIKVAVKNSSSWAIRFVVECLTVVNHLTYEDRIMTVEGLSPLAASVVGELKTLKQIIEKYKSPIAEWEAYSKLDEAIIHGLGIVKVMTRMMYPHEPRLERKNENNPVEVDQLFKGNNVLLFISRVDNLSQDDFSALETVHTMLEKEHRDYKIVWIPVLEGGRSGGLSAPAMQKLNEWKGRMPWYVVNYEASTPIVGIRYIKETWRFCYNPMVVVLNQHGEVACPDAIHVIRVSPDFAFPFIPRELPVPGVLPIISHFTKREIEQEEYIFLYVKGKDQGWNQFGINVEKLAAALVKQKISLVSKPYPIGEKNSSIEMQFLTRIESMLCARMQYWNKIGDVTARQIQKLLSLKQDESGWAMLCKGSNVLVCTSGTLIIAAVAKYQDWVKNIDTKGFQVCLGEYLKILINGSGKPRPCCHVPFQSLSGWIPVDVECPDCEARMERIVTYKCCHENAKK